MKIKYSYLVLSRFIVGVIFFTLLLSLNSVKAQQLRSEIEKTVKQIANYKRVDDMYIGYTGSVSFQFYQFLILTRMATDNELIHLSNHPSPVVRVYAFWVLIKRKNRKIKTLLAKHLDDSSSFSYFSGCIMSVRKVNEFCIYLAKKKLGLVLPFFNPGQAVLNSAKAVYK